MDDAEEAYGESIEELTFNSKPIINSLTMIADEFQASSESIVRVIERTVAERPTDKKLPVVYLLDSIAKNVRGPYIQHFASRLPDMVGGTFAASGPKVRASLQALVRTWAGVFPPEVVAEVSARFAAVLDGSAGATSNAGPVHASGPPPGAQPVKRAPPSSSGGPAAKRTRDEAATGGSAPPPDAALRSEVATIDSRIDSHLRSGLPPDSQLLGFAARACALYGSILAHNPPDGQQLSAKLLERQHLQAELQHALDPNGGPPPPGPSVLPPQFQPPPPSSQLLHAPPPPPPQQMVQPLIPPPPPASGPPPVDSSASIPPPPPAGEAGSAGGVPAAPAVDVSKLLASLMKSGVIQKGAGPGTAGSGMGGPAPRTVPPPPPPPPDGGGGGGGGLKDQLYKLHEARPMQCKTCGVRFGVTEREELRVHMDMHFRRNRRGKANGLAPSSRRWMLPLTEWVRYVYDESKIESEEAPASVFDALDGADKKVEESAPVPVCSPARVCARSRASFARACVHAMMVLWVALLLPLTAPSLASQVMRAPSDVSRVACSLCGENIVMFFDNDAMEWMMRDAVATGEGAFAHSACLA